MLGVADDADDGNVDVAKPGWWARHERIAARRHWQHGNSRRVPIQSVQEDIRWLGVRAQPRLAECKMVHQSKLVAADSYAPQCTTIGLAPGCFRSASAAAGDCTGSVRRRQKK